jgi:hypothetical protein
MKNDFTNIFKAINPSEQEEFRHYIAHFYPQQKVILNTFEQAANAVAENAEKDFLAGIKNNKKTLNDLSDLKQWLLEFLTVKEVKTNGYDVKILTLEALKKRGLQGAFSDKSKLLSQELSKHESPDIWLNLLKLRLNHAAYFNTENEKLEDHQKHLHKLLTQLDSFYFSIKLKYSAELYSRNSILQEDYNVLLLDEILLLIDHDEVLNPIIKSLYLPLLNLIRDKSEIAFHDLKAFLIKNQTHDAQERLSILLYLLNFTAFQIRQGKTAYQNEYLEVAKIGIQQSLFIAAGNFPTRTFNNIVNTSTFLKEYNWARNFIEKWSVHLVTDDRQIAHSLALARVDFGEKKFSQAIELLQSLEHNRNIYFAIDIKTLLARAHYEQKTEIRRQNPYCDALELQFRRVKNINEDLRISILNFIKILRFLINDKPKAQILKALNKKNEPVMYYEWLKTKIEERKT